MKNIYFTNCIKIQNELFFVGMGNGIRNAFLAKMDTDSGKVDCCDSRKEGSTKKASVMIDFLDTYQGKIYALDSDGDALIVFAMDGYQCRYIPLQYVHQEWDSFAAFERYGTDYFIFHKYDNRIKVFHTEKNEISEIRGCFDDAEGIQCACRSENHVWLLPKGADKMYCYDLSGGGVKAYQLGKTLHHCVHSVFGGDGALYLLNMYGVIYRWDIEEKRLHEITAMETAHNEAELMNRIIYAGDKLILLPGYGSDIKIYDRTTGKTAVYNDYPADFEYTIAWLKYDGYCEDEKYYYFAVPSGNYQLRINKKSGRLIWVKMDLRLLGGRLINLCRKTGTDIFYESSFEIADLFHAETEHNFQTDGRSSGKRIYDMLS